MILLLLVALPIAFGALAFAMRSNRARPTALLGGAIPHAALVITFWLLPPKPLFSGWIALDPLGKIVLSVISALFLVCAIYGVGYLHKRSDHDNRVLVGCMLMFLGTTSMVCLSQHMVVFWVAIEAATLTGGPMVFFDQNARSLEAAWKYLLIGSLGVALALMGTMFLALSGLGETQEPTLLLPDLVLRARSLSVPWLQGAFVFLLVGYGTKIGLAPMHAWKPDAYGEAPGIVGALLAGGLTNCAVLGVLRALQVMTAAGQDGMARSMMVTLGILSLAVAAAMTLRQRDFKRMLAYSSVEHMGIIIIGVGVGGAAAYGAMFHVINNGLTKGVLFLAAGNLHRAYGSKSTDDVRGALRIVPVSGAIFLLGFLAVSGSPPFGPFLSELYVVWGAIGERRWFVVAAMVGLLSLIFLGLASTVLRVVFGEPPRREGAKLPLFGDSASNTLAPLVMLGVVLALGLYVPSALSDTLGAAATQIGGHAP
jgi:hydrogenase-4 component F